MIYRKFEFKTRTEIELLLSSKNFESIYEGLMTAVYHDEDWEWVQEQCHRFITTPNLQLRRGAIQGLGLIAVFRRQLDANRAVSALMHAMSDPTVQGEADDALRDIRQFIPSVRLV